jgi:glycosyltransferase involved in cell wall biosynthesis
VTVVSLIMPVWRTPREWLRQAVESALADEGVDLDLILVDDGNDEPLERVLADIDDPRVHILRREHGGPYAARNAGIAAAQGAFLRFVDADDVVMSGSTGRLLELARGGEIAYGATEVCDESLEPQSVATSQVEGDASEESVLGRFDVYVVSILFPRAVVEAAGPWNEHAFRVSGDWDFVLRALEQAPVRRLDEVVTRYRRHSASVTKSADVAAGADAAEAVLGGYFARHPERRGTPLERQAYLRVHVDRALAHAWQGEWRPAGAQFARALRRSPGRALVAGGRWGASRIAGVIRRVATRARRAPPTQA